MSIRQSIRERIQAVSEVSSIAGGRVFWQRQPSEADTPCIVYTITGGGFGEIDSCDQSGPDSVDVAWYAVSADAEEAIALQAAVVASLRGATWNKAGTQVTMCRMTAQLGDDWIEAEQSQVYVCGAAMEVTY